jgi:hypothetical protein
VRQLRGKGRRVREQRADVRAMRPRGDCSKEKQQQQQQKNNRSSEWSQYRTNGHVDKRADKQASKQKQNASP